METWKEQIMAYNTAKEKRANFPSRIGQDKAATDNPIEVEV